MGQFKPGEQGKQSQSDVSGARAKTGEEDRDCDHHIHFLTKDVGELGVFHAKSFTEKYGPKKGLFLIIICWVKYLYQLMLSF